jgi:rhodanese-related sulfurtransferase
MNKYLLIGLLILIVALIGSIIYISPMDKTNTNVLGAASSFSDLSPQQFGQDINTGGYTLLDIRTIDEYNAGHIKGAKQEDFYQTQAFSNYLNSLDKNGKYLIYCRTGIRSAKAMQEMQQTGFANVHDLVGGYNAWVSSNLPTEQ